MYVSKQDRRLRTNDRVLQINGEDIADKTHEDIVATVQEIEDNKSSIELLITREAPHMSIKVSS